MDQPGCPGILGHALQVSWTKEICRAIGRRLVGELGGTERRVEVLEAGFVFYLQQGVDLDEDILPTFG